MNAWREFYVIFRLNLATFPTRIKGALGIVLGIACVVCVLLSLLSLWEGIQLAYLGMGDPNYAIVLSSDAVNEYRSSISREWVPLIAGAPGIRHAGDGTPLVDAEVYSPVSLLKKADGDLDMGYTNMRGVGPHALAMLPKMRLTAGRTLRAGTDEMMVGATAQRKFPGLLRPGNQIMLLGHQWSIVGVFATGNFNDGNLVVDADRLQSVLRKPQFSSVVVRLDSPRSIERLKAGVQRTDRLPVTVQSLSDYSRQLLATIPTHLLIVDYCFSALIALGVWSGMIHVMDAAISARARETAVLRAIGFGGRPVTAAIVAEAMILAGIGAIVGTAVDWLWLDGYAYDGAWGVFRAAVTPRVFLIGLGWALAIALMGALMPSIRAARASIIEALAAW